MRVVVSVGPILTSEWNPASVAAVLSARFRFAAALSLDTIRVYLDIDAKGYSAAKGGGAHLLTEREPFARQNDHEQVFLPRPETRGTALLL